MVLGSSEQMDLPVAKVAPFFKTVHPVPTYRVSLAIRKGTGFTLVELLLALAILGILTAISLPPLQNLIEKARVAKAIGDIHAIQTGLVSEDPLPATLAEIGLAGMLDPGGRHSLSNMAILLRSKRSLSTLLQTQHRLSAYAIKNALCGGSNLPNSCWRQLLCLPTRLIRGKTHNIRVQQAVGVRDTLSIRVTYMLGRSRTDPLPPSEPVAAPPACLTYLSYQAR